MGVFRTSFRARIAPVLQHCTHDFVLVSLLVCGEDRTSSHSRLPRLLYFNFASVHLHPWLDSCSFAGKKLDDCSPQRINHAHTFLFSRFKEPTVVSQWFFDHTCQLFIQDEFIVTVQPYSLTSAVTCPSAMITPNLPPTARAPLLMLRNLEPTGTSFDGLIWFER